MPAEGSDRGDKESGAEEKAPDGGTVADNPQGRTRILFFGDVFAKPGRKCLAEALPHLRQEHQPDLVIANAENASGGLGLAPRQARELFDMGVDVLTSGNHVWRHRNLAKTLDNEQHLIRPANYPAPSPGRGHTIFQAPSGVSVAVINLEGRVFMNPLDNPFTTADELVRELRDRVDMIVIDMHAEATSEKAALAWHLDGRVGAVIGTHTHVQTADARVLPRGTGFISDAGMTGAVDSVIGLEPETIIRRFFSGRPTGFTPAGGPCTAMGAVIDLDPATGLCRRIDSFQYQCPD